MPSTQILNLAGAGILAYIAYSLITAKKANDRSIKGRAEYSKWQTDHPEFLHPEDVDSDTNRTLNIPGRPFQTSGSARF